MNEIYFFWDGGISETRLRIMRDCVYSTRFFNPDRQVVVISNSLTTEHFKGVEVRKWGLDLFEGTPIPISLVEKLYLNTSPREKSDMVRMALLYKYGGVM
jgi:hypothetical protein